VAIVLPPEGDGAVCDIDDSMIGDGDRACVAREVVEDMRRPTETAAWRRRPNVGERATGGTCGRRARRPADIRFDTLTAIANGLDVPLAVLLRPRKIETH
jgi:hypothetical protein